MNLEPITSLADLEFKVKTNKYYKEMTLKGLERVLSVDVKNLTYEEAIIRLHQATHSYNLNTCEQLVRGINYFKDKIMSDAERNAFETGTSTYSEYKKYVVDSTNEFYIRCINA